MRAEIQLCDLCTVPMEGYHPSHGKVKKARKEGLCIEVGYSKGGWGYRQDHIKFSGEICGECNDSLLVPIEALKQKLKEQKNFAGSPRYKEGKSKSFFQKLLESN